MARGLRVGSPDAVRLAGSCALDGWAGCQSPLAPVLAPVLAAVLVADEAPRKAHGFESFRLVGWPSMDLRV